MPALGKLFIALAFAIAMVSLFYIPVTSLATFPIAYKVLLAIAVIAFAMAIVNTKEAFRILVSLAAAAIVMIIMMS